jgi:uncharacterized protein YcgL (UPF0745 family)
MKCNVYRSKLKNDTYLYVRIDGDDDLLDTLPQELLKPLGELELSMTLDLNERDQLARVDIDKVKEGLKERDCFLQLPPTQEELAALEERLSKL